MKNIKFLNVFVVIISIITFTNCNVDYISDPDKPVTVPSTQLVANAQYDMSFELNDQWTAGRGTLGVAQYWAQTTYTDENRYGFRTNMVNSWWDWPYRILTDLKKVIELNEDPKTKVGMSAYGDNNNQIQASRIMMAYVFSKLVDTFGDVPYWSYRQRSNKDFQALKLLEGINSPAYTDAKVIYEDLLKELLEAANKLDVSKKTFNSGDNIYNGNTAMWVKFAHSIRLRLASHILKSDSALANKVFLESESNAFSSNADNAMYKYGNDDATGGPWHEAFTVGARRDFAPALPFVELLYNEKGPFKAIGDKDPRITKFFDTRLGTTKIVGIPYGFGNLVARAIKDAGIPSSEIIKPDYLQPILTYAEVEFIKSEFNGWDQNSYKKGVIASIEQWGVKKVEAEAYANKLPAASEENVLTQKYISLYMDGLEAWTLYRTSGYPKTLTLPGDKYGIDEFKTREPGLNTIPNRVKYPQNEQLLNKENWNKAKSKLSDGDSMNSKIFWQE